MGRVESRTIICLTSASASGVPIHWCELAARGRFWPRPLFDKPSRMSATGTELSPGTVNRQAAFRRTRDVSPIAATAAERDRAEQTADGMALAARGAGLSHRDPSPSALLPPN